MLSRLQCTRTADSPISFSAAGAQEILCLAFSKTTLVIQDPQMHP